MRALSIGVMVHAVQQNMHTYWEKNSHMSEKQRGERENHTINSYIEMCDKMRMKNVSASFRLGLQYIFLSIVFEISFLTATWHIPLAS